MVLDFSSQKTPASTASDEGFWELQSKYCTCGLITIGLQDIDLLVKKDPGGNMLCYEKVDIFCISEAVGLRHIK